MTDYDLLLDIKTSPEGADTWPRLQLWNRYQPAVHKRSRYMLGIVGSNLEYNDIVQEFFFSFHDAIDYYDPEKAPSEDFKFGTILFYFLRKKENKIKRNYFSLCEQIDQDASLERGESSSTVSEDDVSNLSSFIFLRIDYPEFRNMLSKKEIKILDYLVHEQLSTTEIARKEGTHYEGIRRITTQLRTKAKKYFRSRDYVL